MSSELQIAVHRQQRRTDRRGHAEGTGSASAGQYELAALGVPLFDESAGEWIKKNEIGWIAIERPASPVISRAAEFCGRPYSPAFSAHPASFPSIASEAACGGADLDLYALPAVNTAPKRFG